jgi:hypothetical protein
MEKIPSFLTDSHLLSFYVQDVSESCCLIKIRIVSNQLHAAIPTRTKLETNSNQCPTWKFSSL